jgi:hypothetical protein
MPLDPDVARFVGLLGEIEVLLSGHNQQFWADRVAGCRKIAEQSDAHGVRRFLSSFGGMGSLNDIVLTCDEATLGTENNRLRSLLSQAYELGQSLVRDASD